VEKDGCLVLVWSLQDSEVAFLMLLEGGGGGSRIRMEREVVTSLLMRDDFDDLRADVERGRAFLLLMKGRLGVTGCMRYTQQS